MSNFTCWVDVQGGTDFPGYTELVAPVQYIYLTVLPVGAAPVPAAAAAAAVAVVHHMAGTVPVGGILDSLVAAAEGNLAGRAVAVGVLRVVVDTDLEGDIRNYEGVLHIVGLVRRIVGVGGRLVHYMVVGVRRTGLVRHIAEVEPPALGTG